MNKDVYTERFGRYYELPLCLSRLGVSLHMLLLAYRGEPSFVEEQGPKLTWESIGVARVTRYLSRARELLKTERFDLVVGSSEIPFCIAAVFLGRKFKIPVICDIYDNFDTYVSSRIPGARRLYYRSLARSNGIIAFNDALARVLRSKTNTDTVHVLPHSVDPSLFRKLDKSECRRKLALPTDELLIGYFGAIAPRRGMSTLFQALERLRNDGVYAKLVLAGTKSKRIVLNESEHIYLGALPQTEVPTGINACDINTICYQNDAFARYSFPFKATEYIACESPFVAPEVGGIVDYLKDYPHFLYRTGDVVDLAEKIKNLTMHSPRCFPKVLSWDEAATKFLQVAQSCTS